MKEKQHGFWLELISLIAATALGLATALATISAGAALAVAQAQRPRPPVQKYQAGGLRTFSGVVTDSFCGAKHDTSMNQTAAGCTRICLKQGARFALVDGDRVYGLTGETGSLDRAAGQRVKLSGTLKGDTISVNSIER